MRVKLLFVYVLIAWIGYLANNESVIQHNLYISIGQFREDGEKLSFSPVL